jgi:hypothetical protein
MTFTEYKGLPQGSVLSPFLYNLLGSGMVRFVPSGCDFLQYADDIVVYLSHHVLQTACALVQTACPSISFFSQLGLTISSRKSEVVLFSRKHLRAPVSIRIDDKLMPQIVIFNYLWLDMFRKGVYKGGAHPRCMIMLFLGVVGSVLEYGLVCYGQDSYATIGRVLYRGIRILLGLMCSTPNNSLRVLSGIATLAERFV